MELPTNQILVGDAVERLKELPDQCFHTCITSPPYWNLRDYGISGQIGLEESPEKYVERLVAVFREVHRVLRDDGTVWLNLGDSYCSTAPGTMGDPLRQEGILAGVSDNCAQSRRKLRPETPAGLKPKDLVGIPWRVAFALQEDGWYLRSDIIWQKANPMPESVTDRPTKSHEYVFLLSKNDRYFYDSDAIKEKSSGQPGGGFSRDYAEAQPAHGAMKLERPADTGFRNKRSVWTIAVEPFSEAHFAVFPQALVGPCLLSGTSEGGACVACGSPLERVIEEERATGWKRTCDCKDSSTEPCVVLDPFMGSGTTALVALKAGRNFIGIELNPEYIKIAEQRIAQEMAQMKLF